MRVGTLASAGRGAGARRLASRPEQHRARPQRQRVCHVSSRQPMLMLKTRLARAFGILAPVLAPQTGDDGLHHASGLVGVADCGSNLCRFLWASRRFLEDVSCPFSWKAHIIRDTDKATW